MLFSKNLGDEDRFTEMHNAGSREAFSSSEHLEGTELGGKKMKNLCIWTPWKKGLKQIP